MRRLEERRGERMGLQSQRDANMLRMRWSDHVSGKGKRGASIACLARPDRWGFCIKIDRKQ
jgi:hypothetical protein